MFNTFKKVFTVKQSETAQAEGSGDLSVLSTPHMIAYMENTAMNLMSEELNETETSVGIEINVRHLAPTAVNKVVSVEAKQTDKSGKTFTYQIEAFVDEQLIGKATHRRMIVDKEAFLEKIKS
ncbi:MAG: thioesterase family protein [Alkalibacterium gilvum]|uniref:thioesterase family protein n=1 Tax=Alkalibacterium TaxID=99906 RepID=UPI00264A157B|nr:thioesterase family protein [Alkalibacterium sp.]MDN6293688.1 thioesterase family protein [Alkalibacterium sp.]MDN6295071.1 thioesterase family protein [Alkalibacterium sp.]MDN6385782.1 thioesterase family protein [Alkalibacterium sp.]MDN6397617.1 thioesterase family protein [Alkalibacterium sp.]MDN6729046.1 thioesterase family protein [Alkalibacterium sp.]